MEKVYGDRICRNCQGLCAGFAFRKGKKRKRYWCCLSCLQARFPWITDADDAKFNTEMVEVKPPPTYI